MEQLEAIRKAQPDVPILACYPHVDERLAQRVKAIAAGVTRGAFNANMLGALTVGITNVAASPLAQHVDIPIVIESGPEVIMGSSRMKSGTAQKMVLNQISTGVMIRLGHVYSNLMIDMPATNEKLRRRAVRMVELAAEVPQDEAAQAPLAAEGNVKLAAVMARRNLERDGAVRALAEHHGVLREVLDP